MGVLDLLRGYYRLVVRVDDWIYRWTNRAAWPSLAVVAAVALLVYLDSVPGAFRREVLVAGLVAAGVFVLAVAVQLLALSSRNAARFMLRVLGDGE